MILFYSFIFILSYLCKGLVAFINKEKHDQDQQIAGKIIMGVNDNERKIKGQYLTIQ